MNKFFLIGLLAMVLAGCTMTPKYHRPSPAVSSSWPGVPGSRETVTNAPTVPAADIGWRDFFHDPRLQRLIGLALTNNPDLQVAVLNVQEYQAQYRIQRNALIPTVNINASASRGKNAYGYAGSGSGSRYEEYNLNLGVASYELDLFGRVRSLKAQALEKYFATEEARKSAQILLVSEVSAAYLTVRESAEQLAVARQTLKSVQASYHLTKHSFDAGIVSELDLRTAQSQVATARVNVASYEQKFAQAKNYLVLLLGAPLPEDLPRGQSANRQIRFPDLPAGLPSDLLQRRPDILAAENQLKAANAYIGAARAAFFPTVTLTGSAGTASTSLEGLFTPGSEIWNFSPQIQWPIFAAGTALAGLDAARVNKLIQVQNYKKAIQTAFREVADALAVQATVKTQLAANQSLVKAERQRYELADARFRQGVDSYLNVLSAQQALYAARQNLIQSRYSRLFNLINLYQALGGGWQENTTNETAAISN